MDEIIVSTLIAVVKGKLADYALSQFEATWSIKDELEELERRLRGIQSLLGDAAERQVEDKAVKEEWLAELKNAAYDADGILDEFNYEAQRWEAKIQDDMTNKVLDFFSLHNPFLFRLNMSKKLKDIVKKIDRIVKSGKDFGLREKAVKAQPQTEDRLQTHSYVPESEVIGREEDKEKIVQLLLDQHENEKVTVLPIVGMGGLGKTTLAQLVCGDQRVKEYFNNLIIWVYVSEEFNVAELANSILGSATGEECNMSNMDLLQKRLREKLSGNRFLLVLDDVWNEVPEKWEALNALLGSGRAGSAIMVTTRSGKVSEIMGTLDPCNLSCLSEDDSWTLFSERAFKSRAEERPELFIIGKEIVKKCGGLPLAVKALGSLMSTKKEEREWRTVLSSEIWDIKDADRRILEVLRLSYRHLSPHMKLCFAFCSVFSKDYVMEKEMLIQLWMANGFIPSKGRMEPEILGQEIFDELVWGSFFQDLQQVSTGGRTKFGYLGKTVCKMHDLMHDVAESAMGSDCTALLGSPHLEELPENIRHLFIQGPCQLDIDQILNKCPTIFTLLLPWVSLVTRNIDLSKAKSLKVLVSHSTNSIELSAKIGHLKHLRYLDLSFYSILELPEAMCELFNLQTLKLNYCWELRKLPEAMRNMRSLRHLYLHGCERLKHMPGGMGQLTSLQTLTKYVVGDDTERGIRELKGLNLGGELELCNLEKVRGMEDAREANLGSKQNVQSLALCWGVDPMISEETEDHHFDEKAELQAENAEQVLAALEPHGGLKILVVRRYPGLHFPTWMMDGLLLQRLVEIHLGYCKQCEHLPSLWRLPDLRVLCLRKMDSITNLQSSGSDGTVQPFRSLKKLVLDRMQSLESWWGEEVAETAPPCFPCLVDLSIIDCPNLTTMPGVPSLRDLTINGTNKVPLKSILNLTTLSSLDIQTSGENTNGLTQLPSFPPETMSFKYMKSQERLSITGSGELRLLLERQYETRSFSSTLQTLSLSNCNWLFSRQLSSSPLEIWSNLTVLQSLTIEECDALIFWPQEELQGLISLKRLHIFRCRKLIGTSPSPESSATASRDGGVVPQLESLSIYVCENLMELPRLPTTLKSLDIEGCPNLKALTDQLGHLPAVEYLIIWECSSLTSLPEWLRHSTTLRILTILGCTSLTSLPEGTQGFSALHRLVITDCPQLTSLPQALQQRFPYLQMLSIRRCPDLEKRCRRGGEYWHLVSSIPKLTIGMRPIKEPPSPCWSSCLDCFSPM